MEKAKTPDPIALIKTVEETTQVLAARFDRVIERLDKVVALLDEIRNQN